MTTPTGTLTRDALPSMTLVCASISCDARAARHLGLSHRDRSAAAPTRAILHIRGRVAWCGGVSGAERERRTRSRAFS